MQRIDLRQRVPRLKPILKSRVFQPVLMLVTLFGTPTGSRNFGIVTKQTVKPPTVYKD